MLTFLRRPVVGRVLRAVIPLLGGAVFATLWVVAEWARPQDGGALVAVFFGAAIALSAWMPWAALGLIVVVPALQGFGLLPRRNPRLGRNISRSESLPVSWALARPGCSGRRLSLSALSAASPRAGR